MALVAYFPSSQSIAQIAWPSNRISTCLCDKCDYSIHLDAPSLDFHTILEHSRSGYNPTPSERKAYLGMLDEARYEIDRRETELRRLREATQRLEEQKMLLQAYEAGVKHILSPIQNLPLDILGVIFQYVCCGKDATDIANNYLTVVWRGEKTNRLPSFDLSSVCIRWYSSVTSMPMLWTSFGNDGYDSISQSLVKTFLERSRSSLIDFKLTDLMLDSPFPPSPLVAHCNRWRHASIAGSVEFMFRSFLIPLIRRKETPSNLLSLDLECFPDRQAVHFPISLPRLKSLGIRGFILDFETPPDTVNKLYLSKVTCINALSFLQSFPNVESLTLDHIDSGIAPECAPIVFDTIQSLNLIFPLKSAFLTATKFPRLAHLYLGSGRDKSNGFQSIFSLLDQNDNFITLTHLSIKNMSIRYDTIFDVLSRIPSLTQLDLEEPLTDSRRSDTLRWTLELLAAPGTDLQEPTETLESQLTVDQTVVSSFSEDTSSDIVVEEELAEVFAGVGTGRYAPDADGYQSNYLEKDNDSFQERLLLPQLVEVNLALRPRNELLLDVVRSRRPIPENTWSDPREGLTDRAWLQTLRVRYPQLHTRNRQVLEDFEALEERLKPFKEGGLDVVIEIPVLDP
ncbi:hypothetical protein C8R42DRAFT_676591 [Lentinula raphanica]|nr:hypothetical protein C8R42DRAFT_676591 [Lentinula raphanica]